jgi:hypothetical protein
VDNTLWSKISNALLKMVSIVKVFEAVTRAEATHLVF